MNRAQALPRAGWMLVGLIVIAVPALGACNKPSTAQCKKAIANVRTLMGTIDDDFGENPRAAIRSCRGNATKKSVECLIKAKSEKDLEACEGGIFDKLFGKDVKKNKGGSDADAMTPGTKAADTPADAKAADTPAANADAGAKAADTKAPDTKAPGSKTPEPTAPDTKPPAAKAPSTPPAATKKPTPAATK